MSLSRKRGLSWILAAIVLLLGIYALKSAMGYNLFRNWSLSEYAPFLYLQFEHLIEPEPGSVVIADSFDGVSALQRRWSSEAQSGDGSATVDYEYLGSGGSRCMVVRNEGGRWWNIGYRDLVSVSEGDVLRASASVRDGSPAGYAQIQIAGYDRNRNVIKHDYWQTRSSRRMQFESLELRFRIPADVVFIRLRLGGTGAGEFRFDDIGLELEQRRPGPHHESASMNQSSSNALL